jgi:hypothetical protein
LAKPTSHLLTLDHTVDQGEKTVMTYTRDQLLNSTRRKEDHIPRVSNTGAPHPDHYAKPGLISHPASVGNVAGAAGRAAVPADLGKAPIPKRAHTDSVPIHSGMKTQTRSGGEAFGADHSSAIDALTGTTVVPGRDGTAPNHPLTKPPVAKPGYGVPRPVFGQRSRVNDGPVDDVGQAHARAQANDYHKEMAELSRRIFDEAVGPSQSGHARGRK